METCSSTRTKWVKKTHKKFDLHCLNLGQQVLSVHHVMFASIQNSKTIDDRFMVMSHVDWQKKQWERTILQIIFKTKYQINALKTWLLNIRLLAH